MPATDMRSNSAGDTLADSARSPTPSIVRRGDAAGLSDSMLRKKVLPKAMPLDAPTTTARDDSPISLDDVFGSEAAAAASSVRRLGEWKTLARRPKKNVFSMWVWVGVLCGRSHTSGDRNAVDRVAGEVGPFCRKGLVLITPRRTG